MKNENSIIKNALPANIFSRILVAIQKDDVATFENLSNQHSEVFTFCYGRFPVLSCCYLLNSKKIIKAFEPKLLKTTYYKKLSEPIVLYKAFKAKAGVHLRKFPANSVVSPSEMLALLYETSYLSQKCKSLAPSKEARANILSICRRRCQTAEFTHDSFKAAPKPLEFKTKLISLAMAFSVLLLVVFSSISLGVVFSSVGFGTANRPFYLSSEAQLLAAANTTSHYRLVNDIYLSQDFSIDSFSARLDGGGFTISTYGNLPIIDTIESSGTISNLTVSVTENNLTINDDFAFLALTNNGNLDNISLSVNSTNLRVNHSDETMIGGLVGINFGTISHSNASGDLSLEVLGSSIIIVGGIVGYNSFRASGTIRVNGVVEYNDSLVNINLDYAGATTQSIAVIGGVAGLNNGTLTRNKAVSAISYTSRSGIADIGGIVGRNYTGSIINNSSRTNIKLTLSNIAQGYVGGIVGYIWQGELHNNFSVIAFESNTAQSSSSFVGGVVGIVRGYSQVRLVDGQNVRQFGFSPSLSLERNVYLQSISSVNYGWSFIYSSNESIGGQHLVLHSYRTLNADAQLDMSARTEEQIRGESFFWQRQKDNLTF